MLKNNTKQWTWIMAILITLISVVCCLKVIFLLVEYIKTELSSSRLVELESAPADKLGSLEMLEFVNQRQQLPSVTRPVSLLAVGDISFSRGVERATIRNKDLNYPFAELGDFLSQADITFGNLETPLTSGRIIDDGEMIFRSDPQMATVLKEQGFDIVSLANNHTPNFGKKGLEDTFQHLDQAGIAYVGAGTNDQQAYQPVYLEREGLRFAFIAQNDSDVVPTSYRASKNHPGTAIMDQEELKTAIEIASQQADLIIVSMHSGTEYVPEPNYRQTNFARAAIDYGADLVIGHHPHVIQTVEEYKGKYIFYSLGNFVFDQSWSQETADSLAVKFFFTKAGLQGFSLYPLRMNRLAQPQTADQVSADRILQRLKLNIDQGENYFWKNGKLVSDNIHFLTINSQQVGNVTKNLVVDLTGDGQTESYELSNGRLTAVQNNQVIWQTPLEWWVEDFAIGDIDQDRQPELIIAWWQADNSSSFQSFLSEYSDSSVSQQLLVIKYEQGQFRPLWKSINLEQPVCQVVIKDINNDGNKKIVIAEGDYDDWPICQPKNIAVWYWNSWELVNEWRSIDLSDWFSQNINSLDW